MKAIITIITITFFSYFNNNSIAQGYEFDWAKQIGGNGVAIGYCVTTDAKSYIYTVGYFEGKLDFDPGPDTLNFTSDSRNIFILKFDSNWHLIWAKQIGGIGDDEGYSITIDMEGNILVCGQFSDSVDFDPGSGVFNLISNGFEDIFILKLDEDANFIWAKQIRGAYHERANCVITDLSGNICILGHFEGEIDFDPGKDTLLLNSSILCSSFILKLDSNGNYIWVKIIGGTVVGSIHSDVFITSSVVDESGNYIITGNFDGDVDFDPGPDYFILHAFGEEVFILKVDMNGNFVWVKQIQGSVYHSPSTKSIAIEQNGDIYITGSFTGSSDFNPGNDTYYLTTTYNNIDIFILKLNNNGNFLWAKQIGGNSYDYGFSITTDSKGNIFSTGWFSDTVDFDPGMDSFNLPGCCNYFYILLLDSNGDFLWAKSIGPNNYCLSATIDSMGYFYTTGVFIQTVDFDPGKGVYNLTSTNDLPNFFILKLKPCLSTYGIITDTAWCDYSLNDKVYSSSGVYKQYLYNSNGCDSILTLNLTINNLNQSVSQTDTSLTSNESNAAYQWIDCNNQSMPLPGETNKSLKFQKNGSCAVIVTRNGCSDTSDCYNISIFKFKIHVYPNPTTGKLKLDFGEVTSSATIEIFDAVGRIISLYTVNQVKNTELILNNQAGLYFVSVITGDKNETFKVLVQ